MVSTAVALASTIGFWCDKIVNRVITIPAVDVLRFM